jgi:uncharacterized membrane protein
MEISPKRLIIGFILVFVLGTLFAIVNGYYVSSSGESLPLIVYGIAFVSVVLGAGLAILFQWKINKAQLTRILKVLNRDERLVLECLIKNNGSLEQNKIVAFTGLSKVKVTRVIQKLVERDVVEKKHLGNTNLIILKI